jgi:hypothetical protein
MTTRSPLFRSLAVAAMLLLVTSAAFAQKSKRRAVSPGSEAPTIEATLTGIVTEAGNGAPVVGLDIGTPGKPLVHTDSAGSFKLKIPTGRDVQLTMIRTGFVSFVTTVNISGDATRSFQLTAKPTTKVRTVAGVNTELDTETVEFGYVAPFFGYVKDKVLNLCKPGGVAFTPDRSDISKIAGPVQLNDATCCSRGSMPAVTVTLKTGETATAAFVDACVGYQTDIIGRDHKTNVSTFVHFSEIAEVNLP